GEGCFVARRRQGPPDSRSAPCHRAGNRNPPHQQSNPSNHQWISCRSPTGKSTNGPWRSRVFAQWCRASSNGRRNRSRSWQHPGQKGSLGARPLLVLTRKEGGYDNNLDVPASILEVERLVLQKKLVELSSNGAQRILPCGHNMHIECPDAIADAIHTVVIAIRTGHKLSGLSPNSTSGSAFSKALPATKLQTPARLTKYPARRNRKGSVSCQL